MTQEVEIKVEDGVQVIRLLRADKKNALHRPHVRRHVGGARCGGEERRHRRARLHRLGRRLYRRQRHQRLHAPRRATARKDVAPSQMFIRRLPKVTRPMIAAVDGLAVGVGATMLLHCDLVYATPAASFRTPFLDLGLIQEAGSSVLGPARLGYARAFELFVLGEAWSAARAAEAGLINAIVPAAELEAKALAAAKRLAAKPRAALLAARRMLQGRSGADRQDDRRGGQPSTAS